MNKNFIINEFKERFDFYSKPQIIKHDFYHMNRNTKLKIAEATFMDVVNSINEENPSLGDNNPRWYDEYFSIVVLMYVNMI